MSYDRLQKSIEEKLKKYKQKVGENYYTYYYYEALDILDKYILNLANNQSTNFTTKISELIRKAYKLQEDVYIKRNYILSLFIDNDRYRLSAILKENRKFYDEESSDNEEKAIYFFIDIFLNEEEFPNQNRLDRFKNIYNNFDYIDYRILYILYKKYNKDVFGKNENYLADAYLNSNKNIYKQRKTLKSKLAYYSIIDADQIEEKFNTILADIKYLDVIKNISFHKVFIKQIGDKFYNKEKFDFLQDEINFENTVVYEYLLSLLNQEVYSNYQYMFNYIISKYCDYRRCNLAPNRSKSDLITYLLKYNANLSILAYYNNNSKKYLQLLKENKGVSLEILTLKNVLKEQTYFTEREYNLIRELDDDYLNIIVQNLYRVEIIDMENVKCKIIFKFENYPEEHVVYYDKDVYYYLPKTPNEIIILGDKVIYGKSFEIYKVSDNNNFEFERDENNNLYDQYKNFKINLSNYFYKNSIIIERGLKNSNLSYKFSLYILYSNVDEFIRILYKNKLEFNKTMIESFIKFKSLFGGNYEKILDKIRYSIKKDIYSNENRDIVKLISKELDDTTKKQKYIYEIIEYIKNSSKITSAKSFKLEKEKLFESIVDDIIELDMVDISIKPSIFTELIDIAYENNYYNNMSFINICEKFIYNNKSVDSIVYRYIKECYKKTYIITDKTEDVFKIINLYFNSDDSEEDNLEIILNYWIKLDKYDNEFIYNFKKLCSIIPYNKRAYNDVVKKCIDFMINLNNYDKYNEDLEIVQIMEEVYLHTRGYYKCLEAVLYRYIKNNKVDEIQKYVRDIIVYYIREEVITDCCMDIVKNIYKHKYYEQLEKATVTQFKKYFTEILKYELLKYDQYRDLVKNDGIIIKDENDTVIYKDEKCSKENILLKVNYAYGYKINDKYIERSFLIQNTALFIDEFNYGDNLFKIKAYNIMKDKSIYKSGIVEFALQNRDLFKDNDEYKKLYKLYLSEEWKSSKYSVKVYINIFKDFMHECNISSKDNVFIESILKNIGNKKSEKDKTNEIDLFKYINRNFKKFNFSQEYVQYIISKYSKFDKEEYFIKYFDLNKSRLQDQKLRQNFIDYFNSLEYISRESYKSIMSILRYINEQGIKLNIFDSIIDIILEKDFYKHKKVNISERDSIYSILASATIVIKINEIYSYKDNKIYNKVKEIYPYLSQFLSSIKDVNIFLLKKFKGSLDELKSLCQFILESNKNYKFSLEEEQIINEKAKTLFDIEIENETRKSQSNIYISKRDSLRQNIVDIYVKIIGNLISQKINDTYYKKLKECETFLVNDLAILKDMNIDKGPIKRYMGFELNNIDEKLLIFEIEDKKLYRIIKKYLNNKYLSDFYFKDCDNGFECDFIVIKKIKSLDINDIKFNGDISYILDVFIEYIRLELDLLLEKFIIPNLNANNTILLDGKLFVSNLNEVETLNMKNKYILDRDISNNIQKTADYMINILNQSELENKNLYIGKLKNDLTNAKIETLSEFYYKLKNIKEEIVKSEHLVVSKENADQ